MASLTETICVKRVVNASKERVFRAWTEPSQVRKWWRLGEGWATASVDIDLKVGGKISLGNTPSGGGLIVVTGEFLEILPPDRLVYTFRFPGAIPDESIVTVEFHELDGQTEIVITQKMAKGMEESAVAGWNTALESLSNFVR